MPHNVMAQSTIHDFSDSPRPLVPNRVWSIGSATASLAAIILSLITFVVFGAEIGNGVLFFAVAILCVLAAFHARFLYVAREQYRQTNDRFLSKEREFQSIFENALDAILVLDGNGVCQDANPSAWELLGSRRDRLVGQPVRLFYSDPQDFDSMWECLLVSHRHQGEAELVRADGASVFAEFTAAADLVPNRHLMILRDMTQRRRAQQAINQSLVLARSSWQEADALRRATLALTEDLRMDRVLDTLLETLARLVPYEEAQVLLLETDSRLFLAREAKTGLKSTQDLGFPETLDVSEFPILGKVLPVQEGLLIEDTVNYKEWRPVGQGLPVRSWVGVPLISSNHVLGVLSLSHSSPAQFSPEHLRLTRSLATPAAAAIQNARLYERAEIYGAELERRISELHRVERTLEESEQGLRASEERFQKVFRAAPVAMSVTSLAEGRFIEVNETFERRFGFTRNELLGRASTELGFWEDPRERAQLIERLCRGARVRGAVARLRLKSGLFCATLYSAEMIELDSQPCLLVATEDLPDCHPGNHK
jgi:PAS domain S-box-containing protein